VGWLLTDTGTRFLSCMTGLCSHAAPRGTSHTPPSPRAHATHASAHTHIPRTRAALAMPAEALASTSVAGYRLSNDQLRYYGEHGLLVVKGHPGIAPSLESVRRHEGDREVSRCALEQYAEDLLALPDSPRWPWMVHYEAVPCTDKDRDAAVRKQPCRVENFVGLHQGWAEVSQMCQDICGQLFREEAVLFKDKLNFKLPGGGGFKPHQDATAYVTGKLATDHISVMVAVDPALDISLGPVEFAHGEHTQGTLPNKNGVIDAEVVERMHFEPGFVERGDMVFFGSYIPHRSSGNTSTHGRRLAYLTYNPLSQGDCHDKYYAEKRAKMRSGEAGSISINDDFAGNIVPRSADGV